MEFIVLTHEKIVRFVYFLSSCFSLNFVQDHADRVLEAMNSEALEDRLQVEFVSE